MKRTMEKRLLRFLSNEALKTREQNKIFCVKEEADSSHVNQAYDKFVVKLLVSLGGLGVYDISQRIGNYCNNFLEVLQNTFVPDFYRMANESNVFENALGNTLGYLRYRGVLPQEIGESKSLIEGFIEAEAKGAKQIIDRLDKVVRIETIKK